MLVDDDKMGRDLLRTETRFDVWILDPVCLVVEAFEVEGHARCSCYSVHL
jgi:hypothetical protein